MNVLSFTHKFRYTPSWGCVEAAVPLPQSAITVTWAGLACSIGRVPLFVSFERKEQKHQRTNECMKLKGLHCEMGADDKLYSRPPASLMTCHDLLSVHSAAMFLPRFFLLARTVERYKTHVVMSLKIHGDIDNKHEWWSCSKVESACRISNWILRYFVKLCAVSQ
jgi:hypothetical protein